VVPLPPAPPGASGLVIGNARPWRTAKQLGAAYAHQIRLAGLVLRNAVADQVNQMYARGSIVRLTLEDYAEK
jgi:hypothetical protein